MQILATFKIPITFHLSPSQQDIARKLINQLHVQDDDCNYFDPSTGKYVAKYPEYEEAHPEFVDAHYNIPRWREARIEVNFMEDGTLQLVK